MGMVQPRPANCPVFYPKYPLLRTIRALEKGEWGVLEGLMFHGQKGSTWFKVYRI